MPPRGPTPKRHEQAASVESRRRLSVSTVEREYNMKQHFDPDTGFILVEPVCSSDGTNLAVGTGEEDDGEKFQKRAYEFVRIVLNLSQSKFAHPDSWQFAILLSFFAGYCDCCGFLYMGHFTAHVTGNFATLGISGASIEHGVFLKLEGLIVFMIMIAVAHVVIQHLPYPSRWLLVLQCLWMFFSYACAMSASQGFSTHPVLGIKPEDPTIRWRAAGLTMVASMSLQNAFQRKYLVGLPVTTLMTGNTVGMVQDLFSVASDSMARIRVRNAFGAIAAFLLGCFTVAGIDAWHKKYAPHDSLPYAWMVPPMLSVLVLALGWNIAKT